MVTILRVNHTQISPHLLASYPLLLLSSFLAFYIHLQPSCLRLRLRLRRCLSVRQSVKFSCLNISARVFVALSLSLSLVTSKWDYYNPEPVVSEKMQTVVAKAKRPKRETFTVISYDSTCLSVRQFPSLSFDYLLIANFCAYLTHAQWLKDVERRHLVTSCE